MDRTKGWAAAALLLATTTGQAQTLYRCVSPQAAVSYQNAPCAAGTREAGIREYRPEPPLSDEDLRRRDAQRRRGERESAFLARRAGTDHRARSPQPRRARRNAAVAVDACADVRRQRDAWEQQVRLRRSFDQLRAWNDRVSRACR